MSFAIPAAAERVPTLGPDALLPGQQAEVRTVFAGGRIESFDAEILGVLRGGRAAGDMILARATSERVVKSGIAAGMSGSPVYVNGRLIGALSSGWPFSRDPIFGITPIGEMLDVLHHAEVPGDGASAGPAGVSPSAATPRYREMRWPGTEDQALPEAQVQAQAGAADGASLAPLPLPLVGVGLPPAALAFARRSLAPFHMDVVPGGMGGTGSADSLRPGSAVAVDLMRGDLLLSAIGTLTWRDGDRVLIFGHPFFQAGAVRMPLSTAEITTVVASDLNSFKLGVTGREVGVVDQDRRAAVAGRIGARARLLPMRVTVRWPDRAPQTFHYETVEDRTIAPTLMTVATLTSLLEAGGNAANQTLAWRLTLHRHGQGPFVLEDVFAGASPPATVAQRAVQPLQYLFGNPFEPLALDSVALEVDVTPGRKRLTLERAVLLTPIVRPGGTVRVRCALDAWRGAEASRTLELHVPDDAPPGRYDLWVGGGHELSAFSAERRPGHFQPASLAEAWRRLAELPPSDGLHAVLIASTSEWSIAGRDYPGLPASARAMLTVPGGSGAQEGASWLAETRAPVDGSLSGQAMLKVTVEDRVP